MMKKIIFISIAGIVFLSCHSKKRVTNPVSTHTYPALKTELYFDDCDSILAFLKTIVITNHTDKNLKNGYFRIPHINSSYENTKNIFPEKCFIGMSETELKEIFGEWGDGGAPRPNLQFAWYHLKSQNNRLGLDISIRDGLVNRFTVARGSSSITIPDKLKKHK